MATPTLEAFTDEAKQWLDEHAVARPEASSDSDFAWGVGEFSVSVFHSLSFESERDLLQQIKAWTTLKATCGYHAITAPVEYGGLGLGRPYARAFAKLEAQYQIP